MPQNPNKSEGEQIVELRREVIRLKSQRDYWRRRVRNPGYDAARKMRWRQDNPEKYQDEVNKNWLRGRERKWPVIARAVKSR